MVAKKRPDPMDVHVGARIRQRRLMIGWSQEKLADNVGVSFQQVQKYENGANRVSAGRLVRIAGLLNVPISHFVTGPGVPERDGERDPASLALDSFMGSTSGQKMAKAFLRISDPLLRALIADLVDRVAAHYPEIA